MPRTAPFDLHADRYDAWYDLHPHPFAAEVRAVRSLLPEGAEALEVGVGTGRFAHALGIGVGVEPSAAVAAIAARRGVRVLEGVAEFLPFEDQSFGAILLIGTLCFLDDVPRAMREAFRVLRPGGHVLVGTIDLSGPLGRSYVDRSADNPFYRHAELHSAAEVATHLLVAGFQAIRFAQTLFGEPGAVGPDEPVREGHGQGGFVVVRGTRPLLRA